MSILLNNVSFAYAPNQTVLDIPRWSVAAGERVCLLGPSGSGKSTLLNILGGLTKPQAGSVSVCGTDLLKLSGSQCDRFRANHIGFVFQQFNLIDYLSATDNIKLAANFSSLKRNKHELGAAIESLLNTLNLNKKLWKKPANQLSIGQQQRVAIARALINQPNIIIADEPTSALDSDNRDAFMQLLVDISIEFSTALVFVSHDKSLSHHFSRVDTTSDINKVTN